MKIAIDARMYGNEECTGIGTYIQKMTESLFQIDQKNEYSLFLREPAYSKFSLPNERVKKFKVTPRWYSYGEQLILPWQLLQTKFDLIHYPHFNSPILFPAKSVCTIHDITPLYFPGHKMKNTIRKSAYRAVFYSTLHKARKVIAVSESTKKGIIDHFNINPLKIKVIYEGVDERFKILDNNDIINKTISKFGIAKPYIFYIGVWREHKNIETLVKAFNTLRAKHNVNCQLVIGGREDLHYTNVREELDASPFKNDIITPGYINDDDLPAFYNKASALIIPSFIEGFGLTALEAQNCGCPVISSNTTSLPEILGDSALFFNPQNSDELAETISRVLNNSNLKDELIQKGLGNTKKFNWQKCAEETLKVYQSI